MRRPHVRLAGFVVGATLATSACAVDQVMPAPSCEEGASGLIVAQSVPTASQVPCLAPMPAGWTVASVRIDQDHTEIRFDSDRAGDDAATLRLDAECDPSDAVSAPSDLPPAERFDQILRLAPGFRAARYYVFEGGCVTWRFAFDGDTSATESVAIGEILSLVPRAELNRGIRETFVDEEL